MKTSILSLILLGILTGCSQDISKLSKDECLKQGHSYKKIKSLNYRTGKYVIKDICIEKK
ncbi:hypothetical protein [Malaciobacter mytili]|uniref:Lipoprotein n=1 Tax=Malaciobacter mytili LMG 24559 TaxID=1032238 RepID=A0AAX2AEL2_9BACT|nr:hypothetical protein [Malaciobacter mytili]AXH15013.1 hypothetical protein AMYT_1432 [Malaciobacter mytili LMG 24559]RXI43499.1 hypothetical protein CRU99_07425 [Malaciobacter mytili]RXK15025.1 hypothetical protein CP985_10815 [Malaciobacter mytili LMG 24559]